MRHSEILGRVAEHFESDSRHLAGMCSHYSPCATLYIYPLSRAMHAFYNGGDINRSHLNILGGGIGGRNDSAAAVAGHVSVSELRGALCVRGEGGPS